jgi:hypothetical protein
LSEALSRHDLTAVKGYLHPSFVVRGSDGVVVIDLAELVRQLPVFFDRHPEYKQSVEVEGSRINGDTAVLTTRHVEILRTLRRPHEVPSRWDETWTNVDGQWLLADEKPHAK